MCVCERERVCMCVCLVEKRAVMQAAESSPKTHLCLACASFISQVEELRKQSASLKQ